ncbi:SDR family NAD(P)-dependent oxidoreductase [Microlunatus flavus]|uniref:Probable oxidoreductase n=1 Tax=Microlunatus flavus TaxID=1036181 RepID=A0A1H8ZPF8_9ACTN|nr:SDR family NAD(P)-dependent oxidoreductase [Microlunatus flavus]SEP66187.1 NAD(P)-dependent dehydrogenase, short-chain alcohol dehydrogenase family [Microlunatus flavus]
MTQIPFDAQSTAAEVLHGVRLDGRRAVVTGGGGGIGRETARVLAAAGADVVLAVRDRASGDDVAGALSAATGGSVRAEVLDLADLGSVDAFVARWSGPLHVLVNNAGIMATPLLRTAEGWELQLATNHLGHLALATGLHPALVAAGRSRVVAVSSVGHVNGDVDLDDLMFERRPYDPWAAYSQSKTANVLFAVEAARRWAGDGIDVNALNPGRIAATGLGRHRTAPPASFDPAGATGVSVKDVAQGAATSVLLAASPLVEGVTGEYFEDCQVAPPYRPGVRRGVAAYAKDPEHAALTWDLSCRLLAQARRTRD